MPKTKTHGQSNRTLTSHSAPINVAFIYIGIYTLFFIRKKTENRNTKKSRRSRHQTELVLLMHERSVHRYIYIYSTQSPKDVE